jgi:addiction module HigA family antidote
MIVSFRDKRTERFAEGNHVKDFSGFARQAEARLDRLEAARNLNDLAAFRGNRLEALYGDRKGQFSIRINDQWRIALSGQKGPLVQQMLKLSIITEETQMARTAIHPGEHLADELKELKMSAAELARQLDVPVNRVTGIINAQRSVTADTALRLGHWFGTSPDFWLNLQMLYELRLAQREIGKRVEKLPRRADRKRKDTHTSGMM